MRGFIEELRHRNVIRVGVAYIIAGWLIAQVADLASDAFHAPEWFMQMLIILLLIGLPLALFLAWAYELTPEGVKKAEDIPTNAPKDPRSGHALNRIIIVALIVAVAGLVWDRTRVVSPVATDVAVATDKSIAVLPFADFSPGGDQTWFADGLTDEILNALARTRDLRVASRSSAFQFRDAGQNIPEVAAALGVGHILEGSVRRSGDRIRVTAQLIRASDDAHLWSETFDASSSDSIEIQENIAFEIASLLDTAMNPDELRKMVAAGTDSISAWESYLQMNELLIQAVNQFDPSFGNAEMLALYEEIIAEDPAFGDAHDAFARIALGWLDLADITTAPEGYSTEEVKQLFAEASAAATEYARSEEARLSAEILRARVQLRLADLVDLSLALVELRPEDPFTWNGHLNALFLASRFDDARAFIERAAVHEFDGDDGLDLTNFDSIAARVNLPYGLAKAEKALQKPAPSEATYYQAHRVFLYADKVDEAAEIGRRYIAAATDPTWTFMVNMRQACAEGRVADADALYANYEFREIGESRSNIQWLALQTLGRKAEASALLQRLDKATTLFALSAFLSYTHFDPRPYPTLVATLTAQGVMRDSPTELNFACKR
jgi:TolB-like protein